LANREQADPLGMDSSMRPPHLCVAALRGSMADGSEYRGWAASTVRYPWWYVLLQVIPTVDRLHIIIIKRKSSLEI
jgi:hypothetical protein